MENLINALLEFFYIVIGLILFYTAFNVFMDKNHPARIGTSLFWLFLGSTFAFGQIFPPMFIGLILMGIGIITLANQVKIGDISEATEDEAKKHSDRMGNWIFLPVITLALVAVVIGFTPLGGQVGIGIASIVSLIIVIGITKAKPKTALDDSDRMVRQVGIAGILPQLLAALGVVFTEAGVGDAVSDIISLVVPEGNILAGVIAYCVGMALFTLVMGNAFAAFTVITAGIGIPFVIAQGADPVIAGALAMTAGFCGTLLTPMAANFNILPVALLEIEDDNAVIKEQAVIAVVLLIIHIILMYYWAF